MIGKIVKNLSELPLEQFGYYLLKQDPIFRKIPQEDILPLIQQSIDCGKKVSDEMKEKYGVLTMDEYFKEMNIDLKEVDEHTGLEYIYFGTFQKPNKVTIYKENIAKGSKILKKERAKIFGNVDLVDIVKAHELFHFFEETNKDLFVNTYKLTLWSLGKFNYQSKIIGLAEIASMSFAYHLLNLEASPNILDVLLLYPHNKELALEINDAILASKLSDIQVGSEQK